jgi:hypothetical protein
MKEKQGHVRTIRKDTAHFIQHQQAEEGQARQPCRYGVQSLADDGRKVFIDEHILFTISSVKVVFVPIGIPPPGHEPRQFGIFRAGRVKVPGLVYDLGYLVRIGSHARYLDRLVLTAGNGR